MVIEMLFNNKPQIIFFWTKFTFLNIYYIIVYNIFKSYE